MAIESVIFDMDGTLWDSADNVAASWNEALAGEGITVTERDIKSVMGLTMDVIAKKLFGSDEERSARLMQKCGGYEVEYLRRHGGKLYEGVPRVFRELSRAHRLFIVSNCQSGYIEAFLEYYGLGEYITDHLCWGDNGLKKGENIRLIMRRNGVSDAIYVGDTQTDCDSAAFAGVKFAFAAYGFGSVDRCDIVLGEIAEIINKV